MRSLYTLCLLAIASLPACADTSDIAVRIAAVTAHPRLFLVEKDLAGVKAKIEADPGLKSVATYIIDSATAFHDQPTLTYEKTGKRLLTVSRTCLQRVTYLAFAYRMTGDASHARRAEAEMLAVAAFADWNPLHFLDVAEMTAALAIGYDWLHEVLSESARTTIREAIVEKGLKTSLKGGSWVKTENNWNQVCHGGLSLGALAIAEHDPALAESILARAIENLPRAMHEYEPDGVYPEGPSYWQYGTTYNVQLIAALESALGSDFGLASAPGFLKSAEFYLHATGPTGLYYNFADCGERGGIAPAMYWFAARAQNPALLFNEVQALDGFVARTPAPGKGGDRMLPFTLLWAAPAATVPAPVRLHWQGHGPTPVAMHRSGWGKNDTFAAIKGGSPGTNHAHMDIGSFVVDMRGVRWAVDLGMQDYNSLESRGIGLWNRKQDSHRWSIFRLNNTSHNTLVVDGQLQRVAGHAPIVAHTGDGDEPSTTVDMTPVYEGQLAQAKRTLSLHGEAVHIEDELEALDHTTSVRWAMATRAEAITLAGNTATLKQDGKSVALQVHAPDPVTLTLLDVETPPAEHDAKNPGVKMITFAIALPAGGKERVDVRMSPVDIDASPTDSESSTMADQKYPIEFSCDDSGARLAANARRDAYRQWFASCQDAERLCWKLMTKTDNPSDRAKFAQILANHSPSDVLVDFIEDAIRSGEDVRRSQISLRETSMRSRFGLIRALGIINSDKSRALLSKMLSQSGEREYMKEWIDIPVSALAVPDALPMWVILTPIFRGSVAEALVYTGSEQALAQVNAYFATATAEYNSMLSRYVNNISHVDLSHQDDLIYRSYGAITNAIQLRDAIQRLGRENIEF
jgi:hypothetical protein